MACLAQTRAAEFGLAQQQALADELASEFSAPVLLVWRSQRALLVTQRDTKLPCFDAACAELQARGWPIRVRKSGGAACPLTPGTVQLSLIEPAVAGTSIDAQYDALTTRLQGALRPFGIAAAAGSVAAAYCPGSHDLAVDGKKIAGMSQHWFRNRQGVPCVVTGASINIAEAPNVLADAVNRFYRSAGSPMRCQASALTSLRLCDAERFATVRNLAFAFMNRLASPANAGGATTGEERMRLPAHSQVHGSPSQDEWSSAS